MRNTSEKPKQLKVLSIPELKEILDRQNGLLKNRTVLNKLPDKGESLKQFKENVEAAIKFKESQLVDNEFSKKSGEKADHVGKLCGMEKYSSQERYKPFSTLNKQKELKPDSMVYKIVEDCHPTVVHTKSVPLSESVTLLKQSDERIQDGFLKRLLLAQLTLNETDEDKYSSAESDTGENDD